MKVENMLSNKGNSIPNQFIITNDEWVIFQSYDTIIARYSLDKMKIQLDAEYWDYSKTTAKYRNIFLGMTTQETKKHIKKGFIILTNLNNNLYDIHQQNITLEQMMSDFKIKQSISSTLKREKIS